MNSTVQPNVLHQSTRNWRLVLAYDGTDFHGWQVQPGQPTIQRQLAEAIHCVTGERVLPQGSGRTDTGVHALGQVASFELTARIPPHNLLRALNRTLPGSIRILSAEIASPDFHARHSALGKTYEYRIFRGEICPPALARYVHTLNWPLDVEAMGRAGEAIVGRHDFTSFTAHDPDREHRSATSLLTQDCVRAVYDSRWISEGELLLYRVTGSGFLHHMVRNLVGTFLDVGRGARTVESLPAILAARSRSAAGPTAPARGLFLVAVRYAAAPPLAVLP